MKERPIMPTPLRGQARVLRNQQPSEIHQHVSGEEPAAIRENSVRHAWLQYQYALARRVPQDVPSAAVLSHEVRQPFERRRPRGDADQVEEPSDDAIPAIRLLLFFVHRLRLRLRLVRLLRLLLFSNLRRLFLPALFFVARGFAVLICAMVAMVAVVVVVVLGSGVVAAEEAPPYASAFECLLLQSVAAAAMMMLSSASSFRLHLLLSPSDPQQEVLSPVTSRSSEGKECDCRGRVVP
jgi:hypothetical protein